MNGKMMKSLGLPVCCLAGLGVASSADAALLIGWHTMENGSGVYANDNRSRTADASPDFVVTGVSGVLGLGQPFSGDRGGYEVRDSTNSTDGTFGSTAIPGSPTTGRAVNLRTSTDENRTLDVSIKNDGVLPLRLDTLHFDYNRLFANSPKDIFVNSLGGSDLAVTPGTIFSLLDIAVGSGITSDYFDADVDLTLLADNVLAPGEEAIFRFAVDDAAGSSSNTAIDNIAFSGAFVPEPSSLALLACGGALMFARRRSN